MLGRGSTARVLQGKRAKFQAPFPELAQQLYFDFISSFLSSSSMFAFLTSSFLSCCDSTGIIWPLRVLRHIDGPL